MSLPITCADSAKDLKFPAMYYLRIVYALPLEGKLTFLNRACAIL